MLKIEDTLTQFMHMPIIYHKNIDTSIKNLEVQVGELAKQEFKNKRRKKEKENCKFKLSH